MQSLLCPPLFVLQQCLKQLMASATPDAAVNSGRLFQVFISSKEEIPKPSQILIYKAIITYMSCTWGAQEKIVRDPVLGAWCSQN